jgi:predicted RNA-binding Zn-ribbon protein involved in translation (DUF1610 family)
VLDSVVTSDQRIQRLARGWADYRRRQWLAAVLFIGFLPLVFLMGLGIERVTDSDTLVVVPAAALMCATIWAGAHFIFFRCPNCGRRFHITTALRLTNGRSCPHCGLERYQAD